MRFSKLTLVLTVLIAGLLFGAMNAGILPFAILRLLAIASLLSSLVCVAYANAPARVFAGGWAICAGASLLMVFTGVPIIGALLRISPDPHYGTVVDVAFSFVLGYLGGSLALKLGPAPTSQHCG